MKRLLALLFLLLALPAPALAALPTAGPTASSSAAPLAGPAATGEYQCALTGTGAETVAVTLQLASAPLEVRPGQRVALKGQLSLGFPSTEQLKSALLLATQFGISGGDFAVAARTGKHASAVKATSVSGPQTAAGTPFTLTADVVLAPFTVPAGGDDVDIDLPTTAVVANPLDQVSTALGSVPSKVAFTATLDEGGLVASRQVACWLGSNKASAPVVQIPVTTAARTSTPTRGSRGAGATRGAGAITTPPPAALPAAGGPPPVTTPGTVSAAAPATAPLTTPVGTTQLQPAYAAIPPATRGRGIFIPDWALALLGMLLPAAAVAYAVATHLKLKRASGRA